MKQKKYVFIKYIIFVYYQVICIVKDEAHSIKRRAKETKISSIN